MGYTLSPIEKETIILYNEKDKTASCFTYNQRLIKQFNSLCESRDDIYLQEENGAGGITFVFPKKWVKVKAPRVLSEEEKAARSSAMKRAWESGSLNSKTKSDD